MRAEGMGEFRAQAQGQLVDIEGRPKTRPWGTFTVATNQHREPSGSPKTGLVAGPEGTIRGSETPSGPESIPRDAGCTSI